MITPEFDIDTRIWYRTHYTIPFTGEVDGASVDYCIYLDRASSYTAPRPEVVELDGGPQPFILSLDDSEDLLPTTRVSRAQISFVDDISLDKLISTTGVTWRVRLVRTADGERLFLGYLSGEVYTQPYIDGVNIVTVNAVSPTVPMMAQAMPIAEMDMISVGEMFAMAIRQMYDDVQDSSYTFKHLFMPAIFSTTTAPTLQDYTAVLRMKFAAWNFVKENEDYIITGEELICDTYSSAIDALCKFFGWTMVDMGDDCIYLVSPAHKGDYMRLSLEDLTAAEAFSPTLVSPDVLDQTIIKAVDAGDSAEYRQGVNTITVEVAGKEAAIAIPSAEMQVREWTVERHGYAAEIDFYYSPSEQTIVSSYGAKKTPVLNKGEVVFPRYRCDVNQSGVTPSQTWTEIEDDDTGGNIFQAQYMELDMGDYDETIADKNGDIAKRSWAFEKLYRVEEGRLIDVNKPQPYLMYIPQGLPVIKILGHTAALHSGALVVNFRMRATAVEGFYIPRDFYIAGGNMKESRVGSVRPATFEEFYQYSYYPMVWGDSDKKVTLRLRIGKHYWDGEEWTLGENTFTIPIDPEPGEWHGVKTNKTVLMPYAGDAGFYIPITRELVGEMELCIMSGLSSPGIVGAGPAGADYSNGLKLPLIDIADLAITYAPALDYAATPAQQKKYYLKLDRRYPGAIDVALPLHSRVGNFDHISLMRLENSEAVEELYAGGVMKKPEVHLLGEYERLYGRAQRRWRRGMDLRTLKPFDLFGGESAGESLMITGMSVDYAAGTQRVYLSEVRNK